MESLRVGLVGYGGSGRGIHGRLLRELGQRVTCVVTRGRAEQVPQRAERVSQRPESTTPAELAELLAGGEILQLIDVREPFEAQIAKIGDAELIPLGTVAASLDRVSRDLPVVLYCHHDTRSRYAAGILRENGFTDVRWLEGGIDAYAAAVDHSLARY